MPPPRHLTLLIVVLFVFGGFVSAQKTSVYETITTEQGLSQGLINDMIQDKEGFIWIATKGGINRYDGYSFKVFATDPQDSGSISSNAVSNLLEDSRGRIWVGTYDGGVNVYNKLTGQFLRIAVASGLSSNRIEAAMAELPDGRILVIPQGGGVNTIQLPDGGHKPVVLGLHFPEGRTPVWVFKDEKGFVWIECTDNSIYVFNPSTSGFDLLYDGRHFTSLIARTGKFISARFSQGLGEPAIPSMRTSFIDSTGQLLSDLIEHQADGTLVMDHRFRVRIGASGCNFYDLSDIKAGDNIDKAYARTLKTNVRDQNTKCLLLDRSGVLWVGTMGHGIYKYLLRTDRFHAILPSMSIQRITIWNNDQVYVQGWRGSKFLNAEGKELVSPLLSIIKEAVAYTNVLQTENGDYWLYWNGEKKLFRYTSGLKLAAIYENPVNGAPTEQLQPLIEDSRHRVWVCGANGTLARIDPVTGVLSRFAIDIASHAGTTALTQTNAFYEDGQGVFWLATEHGFGRLNFPDGGGAPAVKWYKNIPGDDHSLSYNYVSWFMDDPVEPAAYLWVSTKGGGLNRMEKSTGRSIHFTSKQGLPNDVVYGVLADKAGNIWGSTNKGLFCLMAGGKEEQPVFRVFSTSDGLQADEFNTNGLAKLSNGDLIFGGVNGINVFNPQKVLASSYHPNVYITGIQIGNTPLTPGDASGVLQETIERTAAITLSHLQDVLTLEFSALDLTAPAHNKYRYQLVGIDKGWVESGTRRTATYLHLPSGKYEFRVQGSNSQGIWSEKVTTLAIRVLPPWWLSWWAYIIYAALIVFGIRAYLRFNVNKAKLTAQLNYEQLEAKRVKELDIAKTQLYTNITHEFRTPLTVILGMAQQVIDKPGEPPGSRMDMIVRNGRSLLNLVNQLLDLSKLETGKMDLVLSKGDVIQFLRYLVESFQSLAESQQKQLHFLTEIDALQVEYDREKLQQIVSNLLSNAIKFTPEKGNIYISVAPAASGLTIKVKDTGIGIPEDQLAFVFDRFYQLDNSLTRKAEGTGIGLALTKELVKLMEGDITVKSPPTGAFKGSEFTVVLPLKRAAVDVRAMGDLKRELFEAAELVLPVSLAVDDNKNVSLPLILLVEDNADVVAYIASCLPEYRLAVGKDGREGLDIAVDVIPDLIITDVMMPLMDGFELVNKLRHDERTSHIPVIMLTAKADMASKLEGLQQGADAYLEKPFNREELLVRIQKLLEMRKHLQQRYVAMVGVPASTDKVAIEDDFVRRVREAIEQHLTDAGFTVEQLSKLVFMSHSQLHRKLDALTGCSPNKFIRMIRLTRAKELLADAGHSVASVALDCGYADPGYFGRVFKQEFGVTPQEWRGGGR